MWACFSVRWKWGTQESQKESSEVHKLKKKTFFFNFAFFEKNVAILWSWEKSKNRLLKITCFFRINPDRHNCNKQRTNNVDDRESHVHFDWSRKVGLFPPQPWDAKYRNSDTQLQNQIQYWIHLPSIKHNKHKKCLYK